MHGIPLAQLATLGVTFVFAWVLILFVFFTGPSFAAGETGTLPTTAACARVNGAASVDPKFSDPPIPLANREKPFQGDLLGKLGPLLRARFPDFRFQNVVDLNNHVTERARNLAEDPYVWSRTGDGGHQFRMNPDTNELVILSKQGQILFYWPFEDGYLPHGFSNHRTLLDVISKTNSRFQLGEVMKNADGSEVDGFSAGSRVQHFNKHKNEFPGVREPEQYERRALNFAALNSPRIMSISRTQQGIEYKVKFNPWTNEFLVLRKERRTGRWGILSYYVPDPAIHGERSNVDFFFAQFDSSRQFGY